MPNPTDVLAPAAQAPRAQRSSDRRPGSPPLPSLTAVLAALNAAGLGILAVTVVVLVGWATAADADGSVNQALGAALQFWLVAHGTELVLENGRFGIVPLGLTLLPAVLLFLSAERAARASRVTTGRAALSLAAMLAATYAVTAVVAAYLATGELSQPDAATAMIGAGGLALVAGAAGAVRGTGRSRALWRRLPVRVRVPVTAGLGALMTLLAGGSLLAATALIRHHGRVTALADELHAGLSGGLLLLLAGLLFVPTAVVWAMAYAVGPGFVLGTGTWVTMTGVQLGAAPAFPLLGAVPEGHGGPALIALAVPLVAGVVAGMLVDRGARLAQGQALASWKRLLEAAAGSGAVAGASAGLLALLASGPAGPGRLADVGPAALLVGLAVAAETAAVASGTLAVVRLRRRA